jgi:hypothetical protein
MKAIKGDTPFFSLIPAGEIALSQRLAQAKVAANLFTTATACTDTHIPCTHLMHEYAVHEKKYNNKLDNTKV